MNFSIGHDIEKTEKFIRILEKEYVSKRIYTDSEFYYIKNSPHSIQTAAGIYCAKEAVAKALQRGLFGLLPREIEIIHSESGAPNVKLTGSAEKQYGDRAIKISVSHSGDTASAVCIIMW